MNGSLRLPILGYFMDILNRAIIYILKSSGPSNELVVYFIWGSLILCLFCNVGQSDTRRIIREQCRVSL